MSWVMQKVEPRLWSVGFFTPCGSWHPQFDFGNVVVAAQYVCWLNGGYPPDDELIEKEIGRAASD